MPSGETITVCEAVVQPGSKEATNQSQQSASKMAIQFRRQREGRPYHHVSLRGYTDETEEVD